MNHDESMHLDAVDLGEGHLVAYHRSRESNLEVRILS